MRSATHLETFLIKEDVLYMPPMFQACAEACACDCMPHTLKPEVFSIFHHEDFDHGSSVRQQGQERDAV